MFQMLIVGPFASAFLRQVKRSTPERSVLLWTVNQESWMKWSIRQGVDGVITDDPLKFLKVCKLYAGDERLHHSWSSWKAIIRQYMRKFAFGGLFRWKHGWWVDARRVLGNLKN